jgi:DNA (cytosine-5)-methyltransferase 1
MLDLKAAALIGRTATAVPYRPTSPVQTWTCGDTITEFRGLPARVLPQRPAPSGTELTWSDFFAGAGGSSSGIRDVPGAGVKIAVNHWPLAIETHNFNHPETDHDVAPVHRADPGRYPSTDLGWFSPECTWWSIARGDKCDYDLKSDQMDLFTGAEEDEEPAAKEARWRSRMLMTDVVRFSSHHGYKAVVVENVPDILKWARFDRWLGEMHAMGYRHKVITLNSAFASGYGMPAPQLRDRVYIVFWQARYRTPDWDKWLRPKAWCETCGETVRAIYNPKPGPRRPMRFGSQYTYRCPKKTCRGSTVHPFVLPAAAAIDWSLPGERIGDRKKALAAKTRARIAAGLRRYCRPVPPGRPPVRPPTMLVPTGGNWNDDAATVDEPMRTRTTRESEAVVTPPFLTLLRSDRARTIDLVDPLATLVGDGSGHALITPLEGRDGLQARSSAEPLRSQTTRHQDALVVPLRNNGVASPARTHPLVTFAAGGQHQALVMRNNEGGAEMSTPVGEPLRTVTTAGHQSLIRWDNRLYAYDTGISRPVAEPMPSQTTVEGDALLGPSVDVDDCTLRMLAVHEIQAGMAFGSRYVLLGRAKRDKVRMLGNAVTPPSSRDLAACVMEAISGIQYDLYDLAA